MKSTIIRTATALVFAASLIQPAASFAQTATGTAAPAAASSTMKAKRHGKIDCGQVMSELNSGKKAKDVAGDMSISTSSVYRCKKKEMAEAKKTTGMTGSSTPAAMASPAKH